MRSLFLAVALATIMATTAFAAQESVELYVCNPGCCEFTCVLVDVECCGWCNDTAPLTVEFLGTDGVVLGTAIIDDQWCNGCSDEHFATLDGPVASQDVCKIRVTKTIDDCCSIEWMSIKAMCDMGCCRSKWTKLWKGNPYCWTPVAE